ncbi:MAG: fumarylacetoacetate hydrolase family protein [Alphaproteobacteria bacterium]|nr:fumarylacetoacetate hydrolase family protein [Alphaproteobacteria bacterium]
MAQDLGPHLDPRRALPVERTGALLVGRAWLPEAGGHAVVAVRGEELVDLTAAAPTVSMLLNEMDVAEVKRRMGSARPLAGVAEALANSDPLNRRADRPWLLAPCDLQAVKASGVTFAASLLERLIEERAKGDPAEAGAIRARMRAMLGGELDRIKPGSPAAMRLKDMLMREGYWSQYLEVGIGPDAEIFTKCPPMAAVGTGAEIGIHPTSSWNNPEPEIVLAVNAMGVAVGATLGNDVNLRDVEGRSALLLGKAKDNNASAAIGPFIRLFDETFDIDAVRRAEIALEVRGEDGFVMTGRSSMSAISRDPLEIVAQTIGRHHQYPDGLMLYLGTMFAPTDDRLGEGKGFTHRDGDTVLISTPALGCLANRVRACDQVQPWSFGTGALMRNLAQRGLL